MAKELKWLFGRMELLSNSSNSQAEPRLGSAHWASGEEVQRFSYKPGDVWLGRTPDQASTPLGYIDDRHVLLVSGNRAGKGASIIVNNLALWPGSAVVIDPKGENATVTARRRANGSAFAKGMGQAVYLLDPFKTVERDDDDFSDMRACFNPLDAIDAEHDEAVDEAARLADAIVVVQDSKDPFWEESARSFVRALILHVLTSDDFLPEQRNLVTVRKLITRGDWQTHEILQGMDEPDVPSPFALLFEALRRNASFDGVISGAGETFGSMQEQSPKTFDGVLQVANRNTEFIDSPPMRRSLERSDFALSELKTNPQGVTVFLSLPQRYMNTHFRWLRMMITLTVTEMEKFKRQPACGHRILLVMDEFAGLKMRTAVRKSATGAVG